MPSVEEKWCAYVAKRCTINCELKREPVIPPGFTQPKTSIVYAPENVSVKKEFNPDYAPSREAMYPVVLVIMVIMLLLVAGVQLATRVRPKLLSSEICRRASIAFVPFLVMAVPVVLTQRPRPSYFFYVSVIVVAATMSAIGVIFRRWSRFDRSLITAPLVFACMLILLLPRYNLPPYLPSGRPAMEKLERLALHREVLATARGRVVLGEWTSELANYLGLNLSSCLVSEACQFVDGKDLLHTWDGTIPLEQFLDEQRIRVLYLDPHQLSWLRTQPQAQNMLDNPLAVGWIDVDHENRSDRSWVFFAKM
jgi:hypothetical protein